MTPEDAPPSLLKRTWSRRWVRRLTYLLATGAVVAGALAWAVQQPYVDAWIVAKVDEALRKETGLGFQAERLEIHPFQGRLVLHRFSVGGDLFQAPLLEVQIDLYTFLRTHHFKRILLQSPRIVVDAKRLSAIHLAEHDPNAPSPTWRIDRVEVLDGLARVDEPAWGLRRGVFAFKVDGRGRLPQQVWLDVRLPRAEFGEEPDRALGDASLKFRLTDKGVDTVNVRAHLGDSSLAVLGAYEFKTRAVKAEATGGINLGEALRYLPGKPAPAAGFLDFKGKVQGPAANPVWSLSVDGRQIQAKGTPFHPGTLHANASGNPGRIRVERIAWDSADGRLSGEGSWTRQDGTSLELTAEGVSLSPAATYARSELLRGLTARFRGTASMATPPWQVPDLEKLTFTGSGQFTKDGQQVGSMELSLAGGAFRATSLDLQLPGAGFRGSATAQLHRRGLSRIDAEGEVRTDAADVARALTAWKVTELDMSGPVDARATFQWDPRDGIHLEGKVAVDGPRWHGAHADRVSADVTLSDSEIRITGIELEKGAGHGYGDIWISWAKGAPDAEGIDMCFRAFRLPVEEGLRAADQGDLPITGIGSGWARLHGPLGAIVMEGQAVAEDGVVYGLKVPAASANFDMDINSVRLRTTGVRVADSLDHLEGAPGSLDLRGSMDMDARRERWQVEVKGEADTAVLGLKGPRIRGQVAGLLSGPLTAPLGPSQAPEGTFTLAGGRVDLEGRSLEGIEAGLTFRDGHLEARAGLAGKAVPVMTFHGLQVGAGRLSGDLGVHLGPDSADTAGVSTRLSEGFLKDLSLDYHGRGDWTAAGFQWQGELRNFLGSFQGFELVQSRPGTFKGDLGGMEISLQAQGRTTPVAGKPQLATTTMSLGGWLPFQPEGKLDLRLEGAAELANLKAILDHTLNPGQYSLLADLRPEGSATFNLDLVGKPAEPALEGRLDLHGGRLSARTYPQSIENVDFSAFFHGRDITIPQATPLKGTMAQGALTAWGRITWGFRGLTDYDLGATLEDFQFRDLPEGFEIQGGFNGTLRGNDRDGGLLKGSIRAKNMLYQTDFNITDILLATTMGGSGLLTSLDPSDPLARIDLDLDLHMARPWEFDTNYLKLQGRPAGSFKIMGTLAHPGIKGRMDLLPGGRLTNLVAAGDLVLERGSVEFTDPAVINPVVDLHGRIEVDPYLVNLDISGTLDAISVHPSSTPALRPDEILTILVDPGAVNKVGGSLGSSSTQSSVSTGILSQGAGLLSSLMLANTLERLRKTLTLDRVNFSLLGGPNLSLTLEKSFQIFGRRTPLIYSYKQEGTQSTIGGNVEWRFGNLVLTLGARQVTGASQTPGDTTVQGVQPSGEIRYTWTPK
ncbi:translocation/assembly module TamB domain-containing protein [Mesoterricola silvestris]|uniref:Translocation and assembly module TamB C-terminal domain-containing protein n=1 Tax=Mesoterricola silvestris TaxID=2927979 RepID=A0AA48K914_9BACT|nr:translocation/assembly module TamB domain-containing protein [Mesoterricola silvestris]BDU72665.1 hypothetical protein METEAL_18390 [Mesoterricola silvestris]